MSRTDKAPTPAPAAAGLPPAGRPGAGPGLAACGFRRPRAAPAAGGPFAGMNIPAEKAMNFWPSARRLLGELRPERLWLTLVLVLAVVERDVLGDRAPAAGRGHQPDLRRRRVQAAAAPG